MAVYDKKTGSKLFQTNLTGDQFFSGLGVTGEVISDPKTLYDKTSGRFFVHIIEVSFANSESHQLIAVSNTSDPTGSWKKYRLDSVITQGSNKIWLDYPEIATTTDGFAWTGNMFPFSAGNTTTAIFATSKQALLNGTAGTVTVFTDDAGRTINVSRNFDATQSTMYAASNNNTSSMKLYAISNFAGTPTVQSTDVTVPSYIRPTRNAMGPNGHAMDGFGDARNFTSSYRGGFLYTAHNIMSPDRSTLGLRWYEFDLKGWPKSGTLPAVRQSGNVIGAGVDYHMPAIQANKLGAISLIYTRCSPTLEAQVVYSARKKSDPLGTMGQPVLIANSPANSGPQPANRWGDYFGLALDPSDDNTFWGFGELAASGGLWTTVAASWKISDPASMVTFGAANATAVTGRIVSGTAAVLSQIDGITLDNKSVPINGVGQITATEVTYNTTLVSGAVDLLTLRPSTNAPSAATQQVYVWNWATGKYDLIIARPGNQNTEITLADTKTSAKYVKVGGQVKVLFRTVMPLSGGVQPSVYTVKADQLLLAGLPSTP
ncbi:hypothetical protein OP10G_0899 [Fimbriimonas ginsengisoli Gsoil 348]|uniref:Uncharacterized protein n=2 Tax=Fimbriimonas ginsengisoli TaxID=1005039 RepID=A0A068NLG9_FIMGI|nr:hypothetical protein OP10G_0899 [Fimbriimonas ginsengisoli Gsoil 348]